MNFGNNIEAMGFEKSGWVVTEVSADGNTIYMGKPSEPEADKNSPKWLVKRVTITVNPETGAQEITTEYSEKHVVWNERESLTYKFF